MKPGYIVVVRLDDGQEYLTHARSEPWALGSGHAVILLRGISGGYALERVRAAKSEDASLPWHPGTAEGKAHP